MRNHSRTCGHESHTRPQAALGRFLSPPPPSCPPAPSPLKIHLFFLPAFHKRSRLAERLPFGPTVMSPFLPLGSDSPNLCNFAPQCDPCFSFLFANLKKYSPGIQRVQLVGRAPEGTSGSLAGLDSAAAIYHGSYFCRGFWKPR